MSKGFGICGHKNSYSKGVKVGNFVEDEIGMELVKKMAVQSMAGRKTEAQEHYQDPSSVVVSIAEPAFSSTVEPTSAGLSYQMIFAHGPGIVVDPAANQDARWTTTNQLLHGQPRGRTKKAAIKAPELLCSTKARELMKQQAREKRELSSYHTTNHMNSSLTQAQYQK